MKTMITSSQELYRLESAYKENLPGLLAYARRFVPEDVAGDLVQDVFVRLWQSSRAFLNVPEGQTRQAYLFRSVRNACKDWLKHQLAVSRYEGETLYLMKQEEIDFSSRRTPREQEALLEAVSVQVGQLPERCREIFIMHYQKRIKSEEIAEYYGISRRTVESQLYKALQILRSELSEKDK